MSANRPDTGRWPTDTLKPGWAWADFNQVFEDRTSSDKKLPQKRYEHVGTLPVIDQGANLIGGYTNDEALGYDGPLPVVIFGDHTRSVKLIGDRFVQGADGVKVLAPTSAIDAAFGYFAFKAVQLPDRGYSRHFKFVRATRFPVPPLAEQRRIVAKIEALMARSRRAREALTAVPPLIKRYRQAVLGAAFRGDLTTDWRAHNADIEPASALLDRVSSERRRRWEIRGARSRYSAPATPAERPRWQIPDTWAWTSFDALAENFDGQRVPVRASDRKERQGIYAYYGASGQIDTIDDYLFDGKFLLIGEDGANLIARATPIAFRVSGKFWVNNHAHVIKTIDPFQNEFIEYYIEATDLRPFVTGSAQPKLTQNSLNRIPVPVPPLSEQGAICTAIRVSLQTADRVIGAVQEAADGIVSLDQSILAKALRGELVPQDPDDEPASVLLERIRAERAATPKQQRRIRRNGATKMPPRSKRRPIVEVLAERTAPLTPEQLFQMAGFASEQVDDFYAEIKAGVEAGQITQDSQKRLAMVR